jgi:GNAT superfamily N-acetyltransferase
MVTGRMHDSTELSPAVVEGHRLDADQINRLVEFVGRVFVDWPNRQPRLDPHQHFVWKIREFPGGSSALTVERGPEILGLYVVLHRHWLVNGVHRSVRDVVDLSVDPDYRGRGIYRLMSEYAQKHINLRFDMSFVYLDTPQTRRVGRQRGERPPSNRIAALVRVRSASRLANRLRRKGSRVPAPLLEVTIRAMEWVTRIRYRAASSAEADWEIHTVDRFDERIEAFCQKASTAFELIQERSLDYLNWRYADRRGGDFTIRLAEHDGQILGYSVTSISADRGYVADLLALPGRSDVAHSLIDDATAILDEVDGMSHTVCWLPRFHPYHDLFRSMGFIDSFRSTGAAYRPLGLDADQLSFLEDNKAGIHLMIGDSDHV